MNYQTEQEAFWAGDFGREYIKRNDGESMVQSNVSLFTQVLRSAPQVRTIAEFGCNIGLNLQALHRISPKFELYGYEINADAARIASEMRIATIKQATITEPMDEPFFDLAFTKGVLIHINPDLLPAVYENLYRQARRYIMVCEYYNPSPVQVKYRGHEAKLFKRDFAGEMLARFPDLRLINYGFVYHRDYYAPQDDLTWFLMERDYSPPQSTAGTEPK